MSRAYGGITKGGASFPRVSGDEPAGTVAAIDAYTFSPRERG